MDLALALALCLESVSQTNCLYHERKNSFLFSSQGLVQKKHATEIFNKDNLNL